jgi:hypothetical protein
MWTCGSWAGLWPAVERKSTCRTCQEPLTRYPDLDDILGKSYRRGWFSPSEPEGLNHQWNFAHDHQKYSDHLS